MKTALILLLTASVSFADCTKALKACEEVIEAQDQAIDNLKQQTIVLKKELEQERRTTPAWVLIVGGIAAGVILNSTLSK